jgi:hypothetical protein
LNLKNKSLNKGLIYKMLMFNIKYNKEFIKIIIYLIIFKNLKDINKTKFYKFKIKVLKYKVYKKEAIIFINNGNTY